jgi:hypothetical protein
MCGDCDEVGVIRGALAGLLPVVERDLNAQTTWLAGFTSRRSPEIYSDRSVGWDPNAIDDRFDVAPHDCFARDAMSQPQAFPRRATQAAT